MSLRSLRFLVGGTVLIAAGCAEQDPGAADEADLDEEVREADMAIQGGYVDEADTAVAQIKKIARETGIREVTKDPNIAKVSVVGIGMRSHAGVAAEMFETLGKNRINIEMISTSEIKISCVVKKTDADRAVRLLHDRFKLGKN